MANFDVFNGDADGICSLIQLRLADPRHATLITGVKRDIKLLDQVSLREAELVTTLDISMEKNQASLKLLLEAEVGVFYADHHRSGEIPNHPKLEAHINTSADICTALIVNQFLKGRYLSWALTAAYGDNLAHVATPLAEDAGLSLTQINLMKELGTYVNYNGYGASLEDLFYPPAELYQLMSSHATPFDFIQKKPEVFQTLSQGYASDMSQAEKTQTYLQNKRVAIYILPNEKWARRVSGVFSNRLANDFPDRAHAVLTKKDDRNYLVSIRAPKNTPQGADEIALQFPTGGGRKTAAGINNLSEKYITKLFEEIDQKYK